MAPRPSPPPAPERPPPRGRAREDEIRAALAPLEPGERPGALIAATALASALGLANLIAYLAGAKIDGRAPGPAVLVFSAAMALAAVGMWRVRYLAVLGFQIFLAASVVFFCLLLIIAANLEAVAVAVAVIVVEGWLFWKLVRVLGRMQAPPR
ncbi:MAG: hypothetical protein E6G56_11885 [Actinobacteria bacterium]|nr:MAG: hypothetical protein E6G56_11885 [Actinomycetota bacterium]